MPDPPEIKRQLPKPANPIRQGTSLEFHSRHSNHSIASKQMASLTFSILHTAQSADLIVRMVKTPREERLVRESAQYMVRIKLGKFDGIYCEYA